MTIFGVYWRKRLVWVRLFGYGVRVKDTRVHPLLFSERNGYTKTWQYKHWSFKWLVP